MERLIISYNEEDISVEVSDVSLISDIEGEGIMFTTVASVNLQLISSNSLTEEDLYRIILKIEVLSENMAKALKYGGITELFTDIIREENKLEGKHVTKFTYGYSRK